MTMTFPKYNDYALYIFCFGAKNKMRFLEDVFMSQSSQVPEIPKCRNESLISLFTLRNKMTMGASRTQDVTKKSLKPMIHSA